MPAPPIGYNAGMGWKAWIFALVLFLLGGYPLLSIRFRKLPLTWGVRGGKPGDGAPMSILAKAIVSSTCWLWAAILLIENEAFLQLAYIAVAILFLAVIVVGGLDQIRHDKQQKTTRDPDA